MLTDHSRGQKCILLVEMIYQSLNLVFSWFGLANYYVRRLCFIWLSAMLTQKERASRSSTSVAVDFPRLPDNRSAHSSIWTHAQIILTSSLESPDLKLNGIKVRTASPFETIKANGASSPRAGGQCICAVHLHGHAHRHLSAVHGQPAPGLREECAGLLGFFPLFFVEYLTVFSCAQSTTWWAASLPSWRST